MTDATGPLGGVRLIEMDAIGPAPLAAMILAGLGCEVVRIARPDKGMWGDAGASILQRGRLRVTLDLKSAADRDRLLELVAHADGLMEGARPGVMERLGLGPEECLKRNPALVYGRMTGWGQEGPLSQRAGHDLNYIALTGALHAIGRKGEPPVPPLNLVGDYGGGAMFLALGMVAGIVHARASGEGQVVDAAMVDGAASLMSMFYAFSASGMWRDQREANLLDGGAPFYQCYQCADGLDIAVGALEPQFFAELLDGLGLPADRFRQYEQEDWPAMRAAFAAAFAGKPRDEWARLFEGRDACVSPVLSISEAPEHPANKARGVFSMAGREARPAPAPRFSKTPGAYHPCEDISIDEAMERWG